jgi:tetratricopeptide (TPR) repeat protein
LLFALPAWAQDQAFNRAFALYQQGALEKARAVLLQAVERTPSALDYSLLGGIEFQEGRLAEAEKYLNRALLLDPGLPGTRLTLAQVRNLRGNTEGALALLLEAKKRKPDDPETLYAAGVLCLQMDLVKDANANLARAVELQPANARSRYALASARIADHDLPAAIAIYEDLLKADPANPQLNYALGATYFLSANRDRARLYLEKSVELEPQQVESYYYLGLLAGQEGDQAKSIELLQTVVSRQPDHARGHVALGMAYRSAGKLAEARTELERAVQLDARSQKAHYQLGLVLTALKQPDQAKAELETAGRLRAASTDTVNWELAERQGAHAARQR